MALEDRYNGIVDNLNKYVYHVLGCGAIGSSAAIQLVRTGADNLHLYDFDEVEEANIGVSQYDKRHIGVKKVKALSHILKDINKDMNINIHSERFEELYSMGDDEIVILGFDSMKSRLEAVELICKSMHKPLFIIDGRMGAEHYQQYTLKSPTIAKYKKIWYDDTEGSEEPCNAKATSYCSNMSGSFIVNTIRKLLTKQPYHSDISFNFPTMILESNGRTI